MRKATARLAAALDYALTRGSPLSGLACYMWHAHKIGVLRLALVCQTFNDYVANHG